MYRLFFALWPDAQVRRQLGELALRWQSQSAAPVRVIDARRYHLTLCFIGQVETPQALRQIIAAAADFDAPRFHLRLDQFGQFKHRIGWVGMREPPAPLLDLQARLAQRLAASGIMPAPPMPFRPHVSLLRGQLPSPPARLQPIDWSVRSWTLINSTLVPASPHYTTLRRFPLR